MDRRPRYGDYPELFWDAQPDARLDVGNPVTLARLLTRGSPETIGRLVSLDVIRASLESLALPRHAVAFWRMVLECAPPPEAGSPTPGR
ncbi:MAG TPA: hypothetical protein VLH75_13580 [Longimicrobiales bacterium]|nr:hypothetical protein [Longimicrobiales bacterium]